MEPSEKPKRPYNQIKSKVVALTLLQVLKDTGKINSTEVSRRLKPDLSPESHNANGYELITEEVMEQFFKLIRVDDKALEKFGAKDVIKSILEDMKKLDVMMESPDLDPESMAKLASVKTQKQKLMGQYFGLFKEEKKEPEEADPDKLFNTGFGV